MRMVDDETWRQLDPYAGRLSRRTRRRVWLVGTSVVLLGVLVLGGWLSGLVRPRLAFDGNASATGWDSVRHTFSVTQQLKNRGWRTVQVRSIGRSGPGLRLTGADGAPAVIGRGGSVSVTLHYQVTDCSAVPQGRWPVPVVVAAGRSITLPAHLDFTDPDRPWQRTLARLACGPPGQSRD